MWNKTARKCFVVRWSFVSEEPLEGWVTFRLLANMLAGSLSVLLLQLTRVLTIIVTRGGGAVSDDAFLYWIVLESLCSIHFGAIILFSWVQCWAVAVFGVLPPAAVFFLFVSSWSRVANVNSSHPQFASSSASESVLPPNLLLPSNLVDPARLSE